MPNNLDSVADERTSVPSKSFSDSRNTEILARRAESDNVWSLDSGFNNRFDLSDIFCIRIIIFKIRDSVSVNLGKIEFVKMKTGFFQSETKPADT